MEPNSPKKIQFAVPLFQSQLDPQAAEHIRKRRPTPATLVIYNDPSAPDDKQTTSSQGEAPGTQLSPAQRKQSVYTPPTVRELQLVMEQRLQMQEQMETGHCDSPDTPSPVTAQHYGNAAQWANHSGPQPSGSYVSSEFQLANSEAGGESSETSECQEKNMSSPSSISR
ncbi:protein phosphatase 1 regulatory subunit 1C [Chanos chanos]|uniref:Protein phosphatase 1 regulatory subunit 1C n=1 Tax=Chanos chanos TaxID=29144 RepID=A0A6J2WFT8_CHACN|nr:protein phosphatase 1 regulatory subunit 1C [Chanos chanos]